MLYIVWVHVYIPVSTHVSDFRFLYEIKHGK